MRLIQKFKAAVALSDENVFLRSTLERRDAEAVPASASG